VRAPFAAAVAISGGVIVLAGYFIPLPLLQVVRLQLLDWSMLLAAVAALVAIINLAAGHFRKAFKPGSSRVFSIIVIVSLMVTLVLGLVLGTSDQRFQRVVTNIQIPIETTLFGIISISLAYAAFQFTRERKGWVNTVFIISVVFFLLANSWFLVIGQSFPLLGEVISGIQKIPLAGSRGVLIGISLGSLVTGLRILTGIDRPYSG
jgi:hypothetical protein